VTSKPVDACPGQALQSPETSTPCKAFFLGSGLLASNLTMAEFALQLGQLSASITGVDAPILDRTKLTERYSFRREFFRAAWRSCGSSYELITRSPALYNRFARATWATIRACGGRNKRVRRYEMSDSLTQIEKRSFLWPPPRRPASRRF
jgi:hypothetical protein